MSYANQSQPNLFKYMYPEEGWRILVNTNRPLLAMLPKGDISTSSVGVTTAGAGFVHNLNFANPQGSVQDYQEAEAQQDSMVQGRQVLLQTSQFYSFLRFNAKDLRASKEKAAAYMSIQKLNAGQKLKQMGQEIDLALHRAGNGIFATIADITGNVVTLSQAAAANQFQVGMKVTSSTTFPTDGTAPALTAADATVLKVGVDISGGQTTIKLTLDNVSALAVSQGLLLKGNGKGIASTNTAGNILGMGNWNPIVKPSASDNYLQSGLNRSEDEIRLSGVRMAANGATYREAIQQACAILHSYGGRPDVVMLNPIDWQRASLELQQFKRIEADVKVGDVTFTSLEMASPAGGMLRLFSDPNQDVGVVRILTLDTWKLLHMGELIHDINEDGLDLRKVNGADAFQMGMRSWPQLVCYEPYGNAVVTF